MNIDLVYYFREVNHYYYLNGPEKVNGNIVNNSPSYQLSTANDVVSKINQMIASLAPDISNVWLITSELYTGDIQVNTYRGELNVSSAPDYTSILTSINTNLTNLNSKFVMANGLFNITSVIERIFYTLTSSSIDSQLSTIRQTSLCRYSRNASESLNQSVSPNASITDVISALNTNIHNDLTELNTTTNNKDTVLIIDGQQDFVIRKQNNDDYDS